MANHATQSRILVTGATGTIGSHVVTLLAEQDVHVRIGLRTASKADQFAGVDVDIVPFDYDDPSTFAPAVQGIDQVFLVNLSGPDQLDPVKQFVDTAQAAGVGHIVYLSSLAADELADGLLVSGWHRAIERHIEASSVPYTFVRPGSFMENFINYHQPQNNTIYLPQGDGKLAYVAGQDVAAIVAHALSRIEPSHRVYALTGPTPISVGDVAAILTEVTGITVNYVDIPEEVMRQGMVEGQYPPIMIDAMLQMYAVYKSGDAALTSGTFEDTLGRPPTSFAQFARDHAETFAQLVTVPTPH